MVAVCNTFTKYNLESPMNIIRISSAHLSIINGHLREVKEFIHKNGFRLLTRWS